MNMLRDFTNAVLLLAEDEALVYTDKQMLRGSGARRIIFISNSLELARTLANTPRANLPAFILCAGSPSLDAISFLYLIRLHPNLADLPVLLVYPAIPAQTLLETSRLGFASVLARPYTQRDMDFAILNAKKAKSRLATPETTSQIFEKTLAGYSIPFAQTTAQLATQTRGQATISSGTPRPQSFEQDFGTLVRNASQHDASAVLLAGSANIKRQAVSAAIKAKDKKDKLLIGKSYLRQGKLQEAITAFTASIAEDGHKKAEALHGIAEAQRRLGLIGKSLSFLQQAAAAYIAEEDFHSARIAFNQLYSSTEHKITDNPLYQAGMSLLKQGRSSAAAQAFLQGQVLTPADNFISHAARACQFAANPEDCGEELCQHIEARSPSTGRQLRGYLFTPKPTAPEKVSRAGFLGLIGEVIEVARYTARMHAAS